uniref:Uncharacterized protein n=1 Tax=Haptolina ericina TaxID=156174 RepID=A0A6T9HAG4_9EUKA|mmetsp:Transcript_41622/g.94055  ORF Transcript_41622/g.94055 Transcript_41622/m.94055 type:complete len:293 (-) Transcript_41622:423-1301(-)
MGLNVAALFASVTCCMFGPGLALRGPDGSMDQAVEGLALEYRLALLIFIVGLIFFYLSASFFVWMEDIELLESLLLLSLLFYFGWSTVVACKRIYKKFRLTAEMAVAGSFGADGTPFMKQEKSADLAELERLIACRRLHQWPRRQYLYLRVFWDEFLGIATSVQERRFEASRIRGESTEKRYNYKIHNILRHLELPSHMAGATASGATAAQAPRASDILPPRAQPTVRRVMPSNSGGFMKQWRFGRSEETLSLPASATSELELSAMAPHEHLQCGTISPSSGSSDSQYPAGY